MAFAHARLGRPQRAVRLDRAKPLWRWHPPLRRRFGHLIRDEADAAGLAVEARHELLQGRLGYGMRLEAVDAELPMAFAAKPGVGSLLEMHGVERFDQQQLGARMRGA